MLRRGHEILRDSLPQKYEHVLFLRPSPVQGVLYNHVIDQIKNGPNASPAGPLKAFAMCSKVRGVVWSKGEGCGWGCGLW